MFKQISWVDISHIFYHISIEMCRVREINIKNRTHYLFYDMIDIKNEIKTDERSYKNILLYYIAYVTLNNVKPF